MSMVQAYNTWLSEDYCTPAPDRLIGNALIPVSGIDDAISELEHAHRSGFKTVQLMSFPNGGAGPKPEDDRFWEKALELDMPLSPHMGFGSIPINGLRHDTSQWPPEAGMTQHTPGVPCSTMAQLIVHGVFDRIPELRFYFAEINAALFPAQIYYMDRDYLEYNTWFQLELPKLPSEYMREHGMYGMVREPLAVEMGQEMPERMPLDLFWWGSDFPHSVGTFRVRRSTSRRRCRASTTTCSTPSSSATRPSTCASTSTPTSRRHRPRPERGSGGTAHRCRIGAPRAGPTGCGRRWGMRPFLHRRAPDERRAGTRRPARRGTRARRGPPRRRSNRSWRTP